MALRTYLVRYHGEVQGVGFRAAARRVAQGFAVRGWVKNESDGTVSMIVSAEPPELEAFLKAVRDSRLGPLISREVVEPSELDAVEGFDIRR